MRVSAKYHGIRLEYQEHRHTVLDLLAQLTLKLRTWKRGYISQEAVRVLMKDWNVREYNKLRNAIRSEIHNSIFTVSCKINVHVDVCDGNESVCLVM